MPLLKQHLSCSFQHGEAGLNVFCQLPEGLSFVTLRDLHAFVCKERQVSFNTVSNACKKVSKKCVDRKMIQDMSSIAGLSGNSASSFLYIKTRDLSQALMRLKIPDARIQQVSDAFDAQRNSVYARQSAAQQQLASMAPPQQQPPQVVPGVTHQPHPVHIAPVRQPSPVPASPHLSACENKSSDHSDVNPLLGLLQYDSESESHDTGDMSDLPVDSEELHAQSEDSGLAGMQQEQQSARNVTEQAQKIKQPLRLEQHYTSIPDIDWAQRCPHLLTGRATITSQMLAGTPVSAFPCNNNSLVLKCASCSKGMHCARCVCRRCRA